jgi:hypothetical protein
MNTDNPTNGPGDQHGEAHDAADLRDPLANRLYRDAMAERPSFSPELHQRIVQRLRAERFASKSPSQSLKLGPWWLPRAAAVAAVLVVLVSVLPWVIHPHRPAANPPPVIIASNPPPSPTALPANWQLPSIPQPPANDALTISLGGVLSARLSASGVTIRLPATDASVASVPQRPVRERSSSSTALGLPGSPQWMLARLEEPTISAKTALAGLVPPEVLILADLARPQE